MSRAGFVLRRLAWTVAVTLVVVTATFLLVAGPADPNAAAAGFGVATGGGSAEEVRQAIEQYRAARGLDRPFVERYVAFVTDLATLRLGSSFTYGDPVVEVVGERSVVTAVYLLPAVLLSTVGGVAVGLWTSVRRGGRLDTATAYLSYAAVGLPAFWVGLVLVGLFGEPLGFTGGLQAGFSVGVDGELELADDLLDRRNLTYMLFPTAAMTLTLFAAQVRYVRSETREYLQASFVRRLRAAGASRRVVARNVLANAALPLVSVLFTELLGSLLVAVFVVEVALSVPGLGELALTAVRTRDVPVVVAAMLLPVVVGVVGNFLQDLAYAALDPRVEAE